MNSPAHFLAFILALAFASATPAATFTLTTNTNGNGSVARNPTNSVYPAGSVVTLTAFPGTGWQFTGWSGDVSGALNPTNVFMDGDKVITANFAEIPSYTLTVNVSGGGTVSPAGGTYFSNAVASLTATASNGWSFHHWSGDASGNANPLSVTINANKNIGAVFIEPPTITLQPHDVSTAIGSTTNFTAAASGTGPLSYEWQFNNSTVSGANAPTLALTNVQADNAGPYQVFVSSAYGRATSEVVVLTVECPGTNVVSVGTDAALRAAIAVGGHVRLCFSGVVALTNTIDITQDVTLDASGVSAAISGNNAVRLFNVRTGVNLTITNLVLTSGRNVGGKWHQCRARTFSTRRTWPGW